MNGVCLPQGLLSLPKELVVLIIASLPVFELRGAIPAGIALGLSWPKVYILSLVGNLIPVLPLLLIFKFFFYKLVHIKVLGVFFRWWFKEVEKKSKIVQKWEYLGLILFVAIPLPVTGAWTGTVAATLFKAKTRKAFLAISIGVAIAGIIVSIIVLGIGTICSF